MAAKMKTVLSHIRRSPYQALAAIMIMFLTFFAITSFILLSLGSIRIIKYFESAPQVIAFFEKGKDLSSEKIEDIKSKLAATGKLAEFRYVSIHEAEAIYREKNSDDPLLLELVNYKILPPSIEISASSIDSLTELKDILAAQPGVEDVAFYEDIVDSLSAWIRNIRIFGMSLVGFLLIQSVLIIITITGMKIMVRKDEIEILRLIGASKWFIFWPFIMEGAVYGIIGALIGWGATYVLLLYLTPLLLTWLQDISLLPIPSWIMLFILTAELAAGFIIGGLGGLLAALRFLRK
jgi:cell division transport system permease protein